MNYSTVDTVIEHCKTVFSVDFFQELRSVRMAAQPPALANQLAVHHLLPHHHPLHHVALPHHLPLLYKLAARQT